MRVLMGTSADARSPTAKVTGHGSHNPTDSEKLIMYTTERQRLSGMIL